MSSLPLMTSRRRALQFLGAGSSAFLLAACGAAATPVSQAPTAAPAAPAAPTPPAAAPTTAAAPAKPTVVSVPAPTAASASGTPKMGGMLRTIQAGDLSSIDGHYYTTGNGLSAWIVYETLTQYDDNLKPQPSLAESWDQNADATQIKLNLRKGVQFHSGREMTSDDVIFNLNRILDFKLTAGIITGFVPPETTWSNPDKYTVVLNAKQPWAAVFDFLQVLNIMDKETAEGPDVKTKAVGTGPFTFQEWVQGDHVTYGKNKNYWQSGVPYFDGITLAFAKDQQAMVAQYEAGAADFVLAPPLRDYIRLTADSQNQGLELPNPAAFWMLQPNSTRPPMDDKRVRQALNYALNRQRMIDTVLLGTTKAQDLPWPTQSPASQPEKNGLITYDLDKARSLLQQAGATNWTLDLLYSAVSQEGAGFAQIYSSGPRPDRCQRRHPHSANGRAARRVAHAGRLRLVFRLRSVVEPGAGNAIHLRVDDQLPRQQRRLSERRLHQAGDVRCHQTDATKRAALYSQLNDFLLDEAFVLPMASRQTRSVARANLKDVGHRRNEMYTFHKAWLA